MRFQNSAGLGLAAAGTVPASLPQGRAGGASLCPLQSKGSPSGDAVSLSAPCDTLPSCLHVTWGGSWTLREVSHMGCFSSPFQQGLTQPLVLFGAGSAAHLHLVMGGGGGTPQLRSSPLRVAPVLASGSVGLLAAGLVSGPHWDRDTNLKLFGGCWGYEGADYGNAGCADDLV